jgi:hypothetical protein
MALAGSCSQLTRVRARIARRRPSSRASTAARMSPPNRSMRRSHRLDCARTLIIATLLPLVSCAAGTRRPTNYESNRDSALIFIGPSPRPERFKTVQPGPPARVRLLALRDASGRVVLKGSHEPGSTDTKCEESPLEVNEGRYTVVVTSCPPSFAGDRPTYRLTFEARKDMQYRVALEQEGARPDLVGWEPPLSIWNESTGEHLQRAQEVDDCIDEIKARMRNAPLNSQ